MPKTASNATWVRQPSWWIVLIAGTLLIVFIVAIIRELINSRNVGSQVKRLAGEVAIEQHRQQQLQDLIDYLNSPTFQEQEARLKLGLKREGESVIVVPPSNGSVVPDSVTGQGSPGQTSTVPIGHPRSWWNYFFAPHSTTSSTSS